MADIVGCVAVAIKISIACENPCRRVMRVNHCCHSQALIMLSMHMLTVLTVWTPGLPAWLYFSNCDAMQLKKGVISLYSQRVSIIASVYLAVSMASQSGITPESDGYGTMSMPRRV